MCRSGGLGGVNWDHLAVGSQVAERFGRPPDRQLAWDRETASSSPPDLAVGLDIYAADHF